jgi:hypothetical protein
MNGNEMAVPQPVPDLPSVTPVTPVAPVSGVTDEDRNRYGVLLDHAAERGLLSPAEYQVRLAELAEATSTDQLHQIVTELPAFRGPAVVVGRPPAAGVTAGSELDAALWADRTPAVTRRGRDNPWIILIVMVAVLLVALVVLALVASHVAHAHTGAMSGPGVPGLRSLRP